MAVALITLIVGAVNAQDNKSANYILPGCRHVAPMASGHVGSVDLNFKAGICVGRSQQSRSRRRSCVRIFGVSPTALRGVKWFKS